MISSTCIPTIVMLSAMRHSPKPEDADTMLLNFQNDELNSLSFAQP
jgi:hypothetical protein